MATPRTRLKAVWILAGMPPVSRSPFIMSSSVHGTDLSARRGEDEKEEVKEAGF
jgi:hypothetical protein